jgi:predicted ATPase/DNA-binding SARP family transcriptional activator
VGETNRLRFEALGDLRVVGSSEIRITRPARRRLLSILLLERGAFVPVPRLIDRMWSEQPPADPRNALQAHVAGLRRQLGDPIESAPHGYRLNLDGHGCDVEEFLDLAAKSETSEKHGDAEETVDLAAAALELWRGDPLPDLDDDEFARGELEALVETRRRTEFRWLDALLATGRAEQALPTLERATTDHPFTEPYWERLMLARYRLGDTAGALQAYRSVRKVLGDALGIEPGGRLRALEERILLHDPGLGDAAVAPTPHNLPASGSSFVGRDTDVDALADLLGEHRLVTVTGGPGLGKTRLAVEVGRRLLAMMPGGVWMARLVGATSGPDVAATIAAAMRVADDLSDLAVLGETVSGRPQLLILDNCEHVLDHVRVFARALLDTDGELVVLATSRQRLGLGREHVWRLSPLPLPGDDDGFDNDAVRLLADRAESVDRSFRARETDPRLLAALCRRTDGIPLAIELAASWLPSIGVRDAIDVAGVPAPGDATSHDPHHRSLHAAVDWSFALLPDEDRALLAAASVFRGSFVLEAFAEVCAPRATRPEVAGVVSRLVESSLLVAERHADGSMRYRMLEPVREYARDRLAMRGPAEEIAERHARWYLGHAVDLGAVLGQEIDPAGPQAVLDAELADHRAAMRHLLDAGDHESAANLATALTGYWFARYLGWEAIRWLDEALVGEMSDTVRVRAAWTAGWASYSRADYATATARYEESRDLAVRIGDRGSQARSLFGLGRIDLPRRPERGRGLMEQALALFAEIGMDRERGDCLLALGFTAAGAGRVDEAMGLLSEAHDVLEACGSVRSMAICRRYMSLCAWYADDREAAVRHVEAAERLARQADDRPAIGGALIQRALVEARWGDIGRAAEGMVEALEQLPPRHEIDHCLVFVGVLPVLVGSGHTDLAARVIDHMDRVFDEYGWVPIDVRFPAVARFRVAGGPWEKMSSVELAGVVLPVLREVAGR